MFFVWNSILTDLWYQWLYFLSSCYVILETNMLGYILYLLFNFSFSTVTTHNKSWNLSGTKSVLCAIPTWRKKKRHTYVKRTFLTCNVLKETEFIQEMNHYKIVCTFLPSIFMTGVHPPSPHPKFPMWQKTDNGLESTKRVTTPLILDLLNENERKKHKH